MDPEAGKAAILEFLNMLCGGDVAQHGRLVDWLEDATLRPEERAQTALCVSGPPRCGKTPLWDLLVRLLGQDRCFETVAPQRDVWGRDNGHMRNAACVRIVEVDERAFLRLLPRLRAVMSDAHLRVREPGQPDATIGTRASFVVDTGPMAPMMGEVDRWRVTFLQCSGARVGDDAYFGALHAAIRDVAAISAVREFLRRRGASRRPWARVGQKLRARALVLYWLGLTEHLMAPGGPTESRDREEYAEDFM